MIRLEGEIGIHCAAELKQSLLDALATGVELQVDLASATEVDITAIQLLWAAQREAQKQGLAVVAAGPLPESWCSALQEAGFEKFPVPAAAGVGASGKNPEVEVK